MKKMRISTSVFLALLLLGTAAFGCIVTGDGSYDGRRNFLWAWSTMGTTSSAVSWSGRYGGTTYGSCTDCNGWKIVARSLSPFTEDTWACNYTPAWSTRTASGYQWTNGDGTMNWVSSESKFYPYNPMAGSYADTEAKMNCYWQGSTYNLNGSC